MFCSTDVPDRLLTPYYFFLCTCSLAPEIPVTLFVTIARGLIFLYDCHLRVVLYGVTS